MLNDLLSICILELIILGSQLRWLAQPMVTLWFTRRGEPLRLLMLVLECPVSLMTDAERSLGKQFF
ncbi:hypothetical protein GCK32_018913 [Trichostrongylus colubriformis]|uniref:Uncharacterized protein n=1 Tax=Trichostrongylus colubriformis TaxID=6319 RepID=A0AAN8FBZ9_TRICO